MSHTNTCPLIAPPTTICSHPGCGKRGARRVVRNLSMFGDLYVSSMSDRVEKEYRTGWRYCSAANYVTTSAAAS